MIKEIASIIFKDAQANAKYHPVDRGITEKYLPHLSSLDNLKFISYNFNNFSQLYSVRLMLCLPELWYKVQYEDLIYLIESLHHLEAADALIEYAQKFLEIDLIKIFIDLESSPFKYELLNLYLKGTQLLIKDEMDYDYFSDKRLGLPIEALVNVKNNILKDIRITQALQDSSSLKTFYKILLSKKDGC